MSDLSYLYRRKAWKSLRAAHLREHPLCVECGNQPGNIVDHKKPHRGDMDLFFDPLNLQTLCGTHHSSWKQLQDNRGYAPGADQSGEPLDPNHPWNKTS